MFYNEVLYELIICLDSSDSTGSKGIVLKFPVYAFP